MTTQEKLAIARQLAKLGVDVIEAGFPVASKADFEAVRMIAKEVGNSIDEFGYSPVIGAVSRMVGKDIDLAWEAVKYARHPRMCIFIPTSEIHLKYKLNKTKEEVLKIVKEMVSYTRKLGVTDIQFVSEDSARSEKEFLYQVFGEAIRGGATTIVCTDTVGCVYPTEWGEFIADMKAKIPGAENVIISTHCHNDLGLANANTLAVPGKWRSQSMVLGKGLEMLHLRSGIHQDGMLKHKSTYEYVSPEDIGLCRSNECGIVLGKLSGRHALKSRLVELGHDIGEKEFDDVFLRFKEVAEHKKSVTDEDLVLLVKNKHVRPLVDRSLNDFQVLATMEAAKGYNGVATTHLVAGRENNKISAPKIESVLRVAPSSNMATVRVTKGRKIFSGDSFIQPHIRKMASNPPILPLEVFSARLSKKPEEIIKLDANENPYGPPPEVFHALQQLKFPNIYPDPESRQLRAALAKDSGLGAEHILVGSGADELLELLFRCALGPGDKIMDCPPTFPMYAFQAAVSGALVIKVPRNSPDFSLNVQLMEKMVEQEKPKCIFLASPNNPDGSIVSDEVLRKLLDMRVLVVLDEAYVEFSGMESRMKWVKKYENLVVLRTFSKSAGLAGLRVGYGAFPLSIVEYIRKVKLPYNVSVTAQAAACAALQNTAYLVKVQSALIQERGRLFTLLKEVPFLKPSPSHANHFLCEVTCGMDAEKLKDDLETMGVIIRHNRSLKNYVRISVGKPEHTDALMECLRRLS
ncbi:hypothetical protein RJ640_009772 [Escallonia rubra]|uniref:histidinol-phosphate transaminase n=1 Tax=Escallonia rubra TaxID=112253 RepID=A0AA88R2W9_9ASTE|nr:hypothetical protein RJ640_009772 [Escallonia rubra]